MPEGFSPVEAVQALSELHELRGSVFSDAIEFAWPLPESEWAEFRPDFDPSAPEFDRNIDELGSSLTEIVAPGLPDDARVEVRSIGFGRGFSVEGIALIVVGAMSVIANLEGVISLCQRVRGWFGQLQNARLSTGTELHAPTLSLGTAVALTAADLCDRIGTVDGVRLVTAVVHTQGGEVDHSGTDLFTVVFGDASHTWSYLLDAEGRLLSFSEGLPLPQSAALYWGVGDEGGLQDYATVGVTESVTTEEE